MFFVFVWGVVFCFKTRPLGTQKPSLPFSLGSLVIKAFEGGDLKCFLEGFLVVATEDPFMCVYCELPQLMKSELKLSPECDTSIGVSLLLSGKLRLSGNKTDISSFHVSYRAPASIKLIQAFHSVAA